MEISVAAPAEEVVVGAECAISSTSSSHHQDGDVERFGSMTPNGDIVNACVISARIVPFPKENVFIKNYLKSKQQDTRKFVVNPLLY